MNLRLRPFLLASGALLLTAVSASAQFIELLTEAPVTLQVTLTTQSTTGTATKTSTLKLTQANVLDDLRSSGIIPTPNITGWSLVAVRDAPADLQFVDGGFKLYVVNPTYPAAPGTRIAVPASKFEAISYASVQKYVERHQGQYIYSSKGTVTSHVRLDYNPIVTDTAASTTYTLDGSSADGFSTIQYVSKDFDTDYEIFFYAISSLRITALGSFGGTSKIGTGEAIPTQGLVSLTLSVGAARLVPASLYPGVPSFPEIAR